MSAGNVPAAAPGEVWWAELDPVRGREQGGRRPVVVVSSQCYLDVVETLAVVVPATSRWRGWPNHVRLGGPTGLDVDTFAMTEQPRTIARSRLVARAGAVDEACLTSIAGWLNDFLVAR